MRAKRITLLYPFVVIVVALIFPTVSFSYLPPVEPITQYILDLSKDINHSIQETDESMLYNSRGELVLKLFLSPWGELKDVYVSESSDNKELDSLCLKAVWLHKRYQPFPEELGEGDLWIDVPIVFRVINRGTNAEITGINDAVDIALENHMAARIAVEEVGLSRLKIREARRALYPAASLNYLVSTGRTTARTQDFEDKEYKVRFEYPLYYGWRLKYAVEQAISNVKATRQNYDKVVHDLRLEVELAFYSYIASHSNVRLQRDLLKDVEEIADAAKKRFDRGLTTRSEFLQVDSQLKQITYQVASAENDLSMAKLTLAQAMNIVDPERLGDLIDIDRDLMDLKDRELNVPLEECVDIAFRYRPDLKTKEHMVEFADYGRKITQSKDQFKVDLTGSYGSSGGAYETETLEMATDWFFGVKVSKPLGGSTIAASYTGNETSEKHGESSRTESISKSLEFGILDNLQSFSEKKSSEIASKKAMDELEQTKEAITREVKGSYLDYKKGLAQARANLNKIQYRKEELKIAKARAGLYGISFSELLQAHISLTDERSFYIESLVSLHQSLARLNKATGYALFLDSENLLRGLSSNYRREFELV
ncbi:MAG: TolC family protein [Candidatus Omnitrophica bacterium]|nr:TolC family protein [Candidatus Omnitrophota bacterium]